MLNERPVDSSLRRGGVGQPIDPGKLLAYQRVEEECVHRVQAVRPLISEACRLRHCSQVRLGQVEAQEQAEQRPIAELVARLHLAVDRGEIGMVLGTAVAHVQNEIPALVGGGRHCPVVVRDHHDPAHATHLDGIDAFRFYGQRLRRDQVLQRPDCGMIARPERLLGDDQQLVRHVPVEIADQVPGLRNLDRMAAEQVAHYVGQLGLTDAAAPAHDQGDAGLSVRALEHVSQPGQQIAEQATVAAAEVVFHVAQQAAALHRARQQRGPERFYGVALPQIEVPGRRVSARREGDAFERPALRRFQPQVDGL
ncbi:hypothetical protein D9M69_501820 [compost metagenome]